VIIFPRYELRPRYLGENRVYTLLGNISMDDAFAVYSVNLPEHEYKRWGEADFVIVMRSGLILLEIKGGLVTVREKEWRYENARGQAIISTEGPARQTVSAAIALEKMLTAHIGRKIRCRWGVAFPLCRFRQQHPELPHTRLADVSVCHDIRLFETWLHSIPYDNYPRNEYHLRAHETEQIRDILVPTMNAVSSLGIASRAIRKKAVQLTEQQYMILDSLSENPRMTVMGGAGTGKTELAVLCARAEKAAGHKPAIVTGPGALHEAVKFQMARFGIEVVENTLPAGIDTLIVDEGQDYLQPELMKSLFARLPGGIDKGRWRWFMDPHLQFMNRKPDTSSIRRLLASSLTVTLRRNVRSTKEIVSVIRTFLDADVGISQIDGFGIKVEFVLAHTVDSAIEKCGSTIIQCIEDGILPGEIAVLGGKGINGPVCQGLMNTMPEIFSPLPSRPDLAPMKHSIISYIGAFRGLEARIILLVDLDCLSGDILGKSLLYIGMSRATTSLYLIIDPTSRDYLKRLIQQTFFENPQHEYQ